MYDFLKNAYLCMPIHHLSPIWVSGRVCRHIKQKAFTSLFSWFFGISQILYPIKKQQWWMSSWYDLYEIEFVRILFDNSYRRGLRRCSSYRIRQCESLKEREEQQYRLSRLFFIIILLLHQRVGKPLSLYCYEYGKTEVFAQ